MRRPLVALCGSALWVSLSPACDGGILLGSGLGAKHRGGGSGIALVDAGQAGEEDEGGASASVEGGQVGKPVAADASPLVAEGGLSCSRCASDMECNGPTCRASPGAASCCVAGFCYPTEYPCAISSLPCGDTRFNPHNCGACKNDCQGLACQNGSCVAVPPGVLASGQLTPSSIVVDATNVYWVNEGMSTGSEFGVGVQILKCSKNGCGNNPTVISPWEGGPMWFGNVRGLTVDAKNVYWSRSYTTAPSGIYACPIDGLGCPSGGTPVNQLAGFGTIAIQGDQLYEIAASGFGSLVQIEGGVVQVASPYEVFGCSVHGCDDGGTPANVLWSLAQDPARVSVLGVVVDGLNAYFASTNDGTILSCALSGCGAAPVVLSADEAGPDAGELLPWQLAVDQNNVYWDITRYQPDLAGPATGAVLACAKSGCGKTPTVLASGLRNPAGLATDGSSVYFVERGVTMDSGATDGRVSKCAVIGCANQPTVLADHLSYPHGIAVDDSHVYWTDLGSAASLATDPSANIMQSGDGRVMVAPK